MFFWDTVYLSMISDALACLHWLRVPVEFKIAVLTYKVIHGFAPGYLGPFTRVADLPSRRSLRSVDTNRLAVPTSRLSTVGSRPLSDRRPADMEDPGRRDITRIVDHISSSPQDTPVPVDLLRPSKNRVFD